MEIEVVKEHQDDSKECSCLSNKFCRLIFESDAFTLGLLCQCVNVRKAKLTWIAWNFNGLDGIQSTSWLPKAPHWNRSTVENFLCVRRSFMHKVFFCVCLFEFLGFFFFPHLQLLHFSSSFFRIWNILLIVFALNHNRIHYPRHNNTPMCTERIYS